jgi:hypothetical protein
MVLRQIMDRLAIGTVLIVSAVAWEAFPVLICGLLVGGSAIPLAFRAIRNRKNGAGDLETMLDRRLTAFESRIGDQLVESVEERIDFAEQLLVQQRGKTPEERPMGLPIVTPIKLGIRD